MDEKLKIVVVSGASTQAQKIVDDLIVVGAGHVRLAAGYLIDQALGQFARLPIPENKTMFRGYNPIPPKKLVCSSRGRKFRRS